MIPVPFRGHAMLLQEPWGSFLPADIARLSARQVNALYLKPAAERAERLKTEREGGIYVPDSRPPTFDEFAAGIGPHTKPGADLKGMYAKYLKAWEQSHGGH